MRVVGAVGLLTVKQVSRDTLVHCLLRSILRSDFTGSRTEASAGVGRQVLRQGVWKRETATTVVAAEGLVCGVRLDVDCKVCLASSHVLAFVASVDL